MKKEKKISLASSVQALENTNQTWLARSGNVMPGRQSNFLAPKSYPSLFFERASGQEYWDVEGKHYIDFTLGAGPGILGHGHPELLSAIHEQVDKLYYLPAGAAQTTLEVELAEAFSAHVPCAEWTRFALSGSEAVQLAIRLSRAHTKRPYFVRFEGHYHGTADNVFGGAVNPIADVPPYAIDLSTDPYHTAGTSPFSRKDSFLLPWNDIAALERFLVKYGDQTALILMEAILCNGGCCPPRPGYLQAVRKLCDKYGCVLCFDEVITGFRVSLGSAQQLLGVTPDLATFGKAFAGGMPLSALTGKAAILAHLRSGKVVAAGTFNAFPLGMAAALATIRILSRNAGEIFVHLAAMQHQFVQGLHKLANMYGRKILVQGPTGIVHLAFMNLDKAYSSRELVGADLALATKLRILLLEDGVMMAGGNRFLFSAALTPSLVDEALHRIGRAMARL